MPPPKPSDLCVDHPAWLRWAMIVCCIAGLLRVLPLLLHNPLIALANSYDEVRYSACFDLYPDRPAEINPTQNSPSAPYSRYAFRDAGQPICYWSTEWVFQAGAAGIYKLQAALTGQTDFSVRWLGALKFATCFTVWILFCIAWWRRGPPAMALANGLVFPLLLADPANTIYLNTFYAEFTVVVTLYIVVNVILLYHEKPRSNRAMILLALAAFALAMSKIQHLLLPLMCAATVLIFDFVRTRRWSWRAGALFVGAIAGLLVQATQLHRDNATMRDIDMFNRADVAFTGLLPNASDPQRTAEILGVDTSCLRYAGLRAWQLPDYPPHVCPSIANITRGRELNALLHDPLMAMKLVAGGASALNPWLAPGLGTVEGGDRETLPSIFFTASDLFATSTLLRAILLGGPLVVMFILLYWRRRPSGMRRYTVLTVAVMFTTLLVTVLGDGLADVPKQGHLIVNAAFAWWIYILTVAISRAMGVRTRSLPAQPA
ncbi:MAG: hypothetical protein ABJB01_04310 [Rudaea sp.]